MTACDGLVGSERQGKTGSIVEPKAQAEVIVAALLGVYERNDAESLYRTIK
jgi:hypothetical protein